MRNSRAEAHKWTTSLSTDRPEDGGDLKTETYMPEKRLDIAMKALVVGRYQCVEVFGERFGGLRCFPSLLCFSPFHRWSVCRAEVEIRWEK